ncbi:MAG: hypothetical protein JWL67_1565 [Solirubrobacterales bacterium]|nr:hypothetical protein [Solirubrobacterales bacterium]
MSAGAPVINEAATIARRMAAKLGCETIALIGCVRPRLITELAASQLAGFDEPEHISYAAAVLPTETWRPFREAMTAIGDLPSPFVMISARALDALMDHDVALILASTPAAIVVDVDDHAGRGVPALTQQTSRLRERGFVCLRSELISSVAEESHRRSSPAIILADGHDPRPGPLVETGLNSLRLDPQADTFSAASRPARVCIVSYEVVGPSRNGGIGTANTSLALALARAGHDVSLLFTGVSPDPGSHTRWRETFAEQGVSYAELDRGRVDAVGSPHINVRLAWTAYQWVRERHNERPFDVIHGPECQGHLAYIALAKQHGLAFDATQIVTGLHSCTRWCYEANREAVSTLNSLTDDYLERTATEASDVVISPSGYMLSYLRKLGWRLPERTFVQQYVTSQAVRDIGRLVAHRPPEVADSVKEIVFFGRLELRKGIEVFCDALDELADGHVPELSVTFMGSSVRVHGNPSTTYIERRAANWPWKVKTMTNVPHSDAVAYLSESGRLAVMPSLVDNSPNTVYESIALGIPMIVSRSGGTRELIAVEDLERSSYAGEPEDDLLGPSSSEPPTSRLNHESLSSTIRKALEHPSGAVRRAVDRDKNDDCHMAWHGALASEPNTAAPPIRRPTPRVSVIFAAPLVDGTLDSLTALTDEMDAEILVAVPARIGAAQGWRQIETGHVTRGRALNLAALAATGDVVLAFPPGVLPEARAPTVIAGAACGSTADVFTFPVLDVIDGPDGRPGTVVPVGGPALLGLSYAYFGSCGFAIRAEALRRLGGFSESRTVTAPEVELLNRAALAGFRIDVVPEISARRTSPDPLWRVYANEVWFEAMAWDAPPEEQLETLRLFRGADISADLPALYRGSQQWAADLHARHLAEHVRWSEANDEIHAQAIRTQQAYEDLRAHAEHVQQSYDVVAQSESSLRAALEVVYKSRSWRITSPLRALRTRRRAI